MADDTPQQIQTLQEQLILKEQLLVQSQTEILSLRQEKQNVSDRESFLKNAQQQLVKKIKEIAHLQETNEEQNQLIQELKRLLDEQQAQCISLQKILDSQTQNEKKLQNNLQELIRNSDLQLKRWEEKYFQLHEKWQHAENRLHSMRSLESKQHQILHLLATLESLINNVSHPEVSKSIPVENSLFERAPVQQFKNSLFD